MSEVYDQVAKWCSDNPMMVYGNQGDEIPLKVVESLIGGSLESFDEWISECEMHATDFYFSDHQKEMVKELFGEADEYDSIEEFESIVEEADTAFSENWQTDSSDLVRTVLNNTSPNIVAIPLDSADEPFEFPFFEIDRDESARRIRELRKLGIRNPYKAECCYGHESLKVLGKIDLKELYDNLCHGRQLWGITLGAAGHALSHTSWNGSGGLGEIAISKQTDIRASFNCDENNRYGVQAVYGFVGSVWSEELRVIYK